VAEQTRLRILEGAYRCVARDGLEATTLDAVAREAAVARATVYRYFPGGREELVRAVVSWEVGRFFDALAAEVGEVDSFAGWVEATLGAARRRLDGHEVLHKALREDAGQVVTPLAETLPIALGVLHEQVRERLERVPAEELCPGVEVGPAADLVARLMLSFTGTPGSWRADDPAELHRLVNHHLLAGVLAHP
jgi:AcrR family transcriptional regulator